MIKFNKPNSLNGSQLCRELIAAGVKINDPFDTCSIDEYGNFWLKIDKKDEAKAKLNFDPSYKHVLHVGLFTDGKNQGHIFDVARKLKKYKIWPLRRPFLFLI